MTLVMGIVCHDCLMFCADREESTEYGGKRSVSKIHEGWGDDWMMGIATAGSPYVADIAALRIISEAKAQPNFIKDPSSSIEKVLLRIYRKYIFPRDTRRQQERGISLVIGIMNTETTEKFLFKTYEELVKPENHYACAGVGQEIAHYFLDRFWGDGLNGHEALRLAAFVVREAKASVGGVGRESEFLKFIKTDEGRGVSTRQLSGDDVWRDVPHLQHCIIPFWKSGGGTNAKRQSSS